MKKVIVRLGNGLGNQLFTYAAAYAFSKKNNAELLIDNESGFYKRYKYELNHFNISAAIASEKNKFKGFYGKTKRKILLSLSKINLNKKFLVETKNKKKLTFYNPEQFNISFEDHLFFEGYFQSEKYFDDYKKDIENEYKFKDNIVKHKSSFIDQIIKRNSVSIHIRQDKFLLDEGHKNFKKLNKENFQVNIKNCEKGINFLDKKLDNPVYFIWSNNFNGLREYFPSKKFIFVDENLKKDPAYDLYLMSKCKHFILSPSTLHYWGARLSSNLDKICISPSNIQNTSGYYGFSNNKDIKPSWWYDL